MDPKICNFWRKFAEIISILSPLAYSPYAFSNYVYYDKTLIAYPRNSHKELRTRGNELALSTRPDYYEKIEWKIIHRPLKNNLQILFFIYPFKKFLPAYMENMLNGEKSIKIMRISVNNKST